MKSMMRATLLAAGLLFAAGAQAQSPPANGKAAVTATCKDGTSFSGATKHGACAGHGGVKAWGAAAKAGGGAGKVWANTESKTYHCQGTKWYGKTRHGAYMTESAARAAGYHAAGGKACS